MENNVVDDVDYAKISVEMENPPPPETPTKIEHIVIAGGGAIGIVFLGILKEIHEKKIWEHKNIKSIDATSVGTVLACIVALDIDWKTVIDYFIYRPWENVFTVNNNIFQSFYRKGILGINIFEEIFEPLLKSKGFTKEITLEEFYRETGVSIHFTVTDLNTLSLVDVSHHSHPSWKVIEAVYASCCLPIVFEPFFKEGEYYIDGGIVCNYPYELCKKQEKTTEDAILGINIDYELPKINEESNIFEYINYFVFLLVRKVHCVDIAVFGKNKMEMVVKIMNELSFYDIMNTMRNTNIRIMLIQRGEQIAKDFISSLSLSCENPTE